MAGGPDRVWKHYERLVRQGDLHGAMRSARLFDLPLDLSDMLRLTLLAARKKDDVFQRMAVRWIVRLDAGGKLELREVKFIVCRFERAWAGDGRGGHELHHFLATGRRP